MYLASIARSTCGAQPSIPLSAEISYLTTVLRYRSREIPNPIGTLFPVLAYINCDGVAPSSASKLLTLTWSRFHESAANSLQAILELHLARIRRRKRVSSPLHNDEGWFTSTSHEVTGQVTTSWSLQYLQENENYVSVIRSDTYDSEKL